MKHCLEHVPSLENIFKADYYIAVLPVAMSRGVNCLDPYLHIIYLHAYIYIYLKRGGRDLG